MLIPFSTQSFNTIDILCDQFNEVIEKALNLKGYTFKDGNELYGFILRNCRSENTKTKDGNINRTQIKYYVNNEPLLLYSLEIITEKINSEPKENYTLTIKTGKYEFL